MISAPHKNIYITPSSSETFFCFAVISFHFLLRYGTPKGYKKREAWGEASFKTATAKEHFSQTYTPYHCCIAWKIMNS